MSKERKPFIEALIKAQYDVLSSKDNKERLLFTIAGIKDGHFYNHTGTDFGLFDDEVEDVEFIVKEDLKLGRITGVKLGRIQAKMNQFFADYYGIGNEVDDHVKEEEKEDSDEKEESPKKSKKGNKKEKSKVEEPTSDTNDETPNVDAMVDACKECIKNGKFKKAKKLIAKLDGKIAKKLAKKLMKAEGK